MKKIFLLIGLFLLPFFATAQEVSMLDQTVVDGETSLYTVDTARKFKRVKEIVKDAKVCLQLPSHISSIQGGYGCFYNIEKIKSDFATENLDSFLKDKNNRIVLAAVANYVMGISGSTYHDNYELFITMGIDSVEAAVRTGEERYLEEALNYGRISYCYWKTLKSFGITSAECHTQSIEGKTSEKEIKEIKTKLENEKPLVDNFKKEVEKFNRQIRQQIRRERKKAFVDKANNVMQNLENKLEKYIEPPPALMRWAISVSKKS